MELYEQNRALVEFGFGGSWGRRSAKAGFGATAGANATETAPGLVPLSAGGVDAGG